MFYNDHIFTASYMLDFFFFFSFDLYFGLLTAMMAKGFFTNLYLMYVCAGFFHRAFVTSNHVSVIRFFLHSLCLFVVFITGLRENATFQSETNIDM